MGARRWLRRLGRLFRRGRLEREMEAELRDHLAREMESHVAAGMTPAEARRAALRAFGPPDRVREEARAARGWRPLDELGQDLRFALRGLRRAPGFAAVALLTLGLGIGANTAIFSVVRGVLLRDLPFAEADRLVRLHEYDETGEGRGTISHANMVDWRERSTSFAGMAAYDEWRVLLETEGEAEVLDGAAVGAAYFDVLGVEPALGRFFLPEEDDGTSRVVVLTHELFQRRFGGDAAVLGGTVQVNGFDYVVVGVAPAGLEDPALSGPSFDPPALWRPSLPHFFTNDRGSRSFTAVARLAPGVGLETAQAELTAIHATLAATYPAENAGYTVRVVPLVENIVGGARPLLAVLMGAVGLVLLVACANVANLQLSRAAGRARELAVRTSLGASRARVARQLLVESTVLGVLGGAVGVGLGAVGTRALVLLGGGQLPRLAQVRMDGAVLAFAAAAAVLTGILFGLVPALQVRGDASAALREGSGRATPGRSRRRARSLLVAAEVAMAVVLLAGAGLLAQSLLRLQAVDPGLRSDGVLTLRLRPPAGAYAEPGQLDRLQDALLERVAALPGVAAAGTVDLLPFSGSFNGMGLHVEGRPDVPGELPSAETRAASSGFFDVLEIALLEGRGIGPQDRAGAPPVVVVSRSVADELWPEGGALGSRLRLGDELWREVVGVVEDVAQFSLEAGRDPALYLPEPQALDWMRGSPTLVLRTTGDPGTAAPAVRGAIRAVEPRMAITAVRSMDAVVGATLGAPRFRTFLLGLFAALAFALGAVGIYGVVAQGVAERRGEMGVRVALGARRGQVVGLILAQGLRPVLAGLVVGVAGALAGGRLLAAFLFQVRPADPLTLTLVPLALLAVAAGAAGLPAWRAARTDPARVLRTE